MAEFCWKIFSKSNRSALTTHDLAIPGQTPELVNIKFATILYRFLKIICYLVKTGLEQFGCWVKPLIFKAFILQKKLRSRFSLFKYFLSVTSIEINKSEARFKILKLFAVVFNRK